MILRRLYEYPCPAGNIYKSRSLRQDSYIDYEDEAIWDMILADQNLRVRECPVDIHEFCVSFTLPE